MTSTSKKDEEDGDEIKLDGDAPRALADGFHAALVGGELARRRAARPENARDGMDDEGQPRG